MKFWVNLNATFDRDITEESKLLDELQEIVGKMAKARVYFSYKFDEHAPIEERKPVRYFDNQPQK